MKSSEADSPTFRNFAEYKSYCSGKKEPEPAPNQSKYYLLGRKLAEQAYEAARRELYEEDQE